jgi:hypothetical protein
MDAIGAVVMTVGGLAGSQIATRPDLAQGFLAALPVFLGDPPRLHLRYGHEAAVVERGKVL